MCRLWHNKKIKFQSSSTKIQMAVLVVGFLFGAWDLSVGVSAHAAEVERDDFLKTIERFDLSNPVPPTPKAPPPPPLAAPGGLLPPFNVQAVVLGNKVTLHWQWQAPTPAPVFDAFAFYVSRGSTTIGTVTETSFVDSDLGFGTYTYRVRAQGYMKSRKKGTVLASEWSEPAEGLVKVLCSAAPQVTLTAEPLKTSYRGSIPSLRIRLRGDTQVPAGCSLTKLTYTVDSGRGIQHQGALSVDAHGHFDDFIDAIQSTDEPPTDDTTFTVAVVAEDEAGPTTSNAYQITIRLQNPYAPQ